MCKLEPTVKKETLYIAAWVVILSILMQAVFLIVDVFRPEAIWDYTVLLGNLLSAIAAVLNFLLLGITVQKAVTKEEKEARHLMKLSQTYRFFGMIAIAVIGILVPFFHPLATVIPLLFPRIAILFRPLFKSYNND